MRMSQIQHTKFPCKHFLMVLALTGGILFGGKLNLKAQSALSGAYIGQFSTWQRDKDANTTEQHSRLYNRILLQYTPSENFAFRTAVRRADFFQENIGSTHFYYGYLFWKPMKNAELTLGRQYPYSKMIRRAVDGVSVEYGFLPHWTFEGLWGIYSPTDREGFASNPSDEHGSYFALHYQTDDHASFRASGYQQVAGGRVLNFMGLDGRYPDLWGATLYGFFKYNFSQNLVQEAEGQLRREFGDCLGITAAYKYRDPNYDIPDWYWQFAVDPFSTFRGVVDFYVTNTGGITAEYFTRMLHSSQIQRYRLGWLATNWAAGVVYALDTNQQRNEWNAYGNIQHHFGKALLIGAGLNYFDYVLNEEYESPLNAFGSQIFVKYRLLDALTIGSRVYYLTNAAYSKDVRFVGELGYQF